MLGEKARVKHYGELDFHQINNGPIFGEDTEKILKEVFNKR